jgi:DNA (cytosine-5)-methyltransferase 1
LVGIRKDIATSLKPKMFFDQIKTNRDNFLVSRGLSMTTTLEEAISDLLKSHGVMECPDSTGFQTGKYGLIQSGYQKYMRSQNTNLIPDSHRFPNHREEIRNRFIDILENAQKNKTISEYIKKQYGIKKHTLIPLGGDTPASTITTLPDDYLHYCEPRIFTVREYARIQSFKDWYEFKGKYTTGGKERTKEVPRYSQVGNAIPPLFGEQVGLVLKSFTNHNA